MMPRLRVKEQNEPCALATVMSQEICRRSKTWGVGLRRGQLISGSEKVGTNGGVTSDQALTGGTLGRWLPAALGRATAIAIAQDGPQAAATRAAGMLMFLLSSSNAGPGRTRQRRTEQRARSRKAAGSAEGR